MDRLRKDQFTFFQYSSPAVLKQKQNGKISTLNRANLDIDIK